ncbi:putative oxidoreductase C-terminal domain-containing protein [Algoriphagus sp. D3-2-R+10]|uniref:putative oxidoreductase C-terminal domain-containing protein n=1 Tax=Algoriphagus aurantiacus TaxID=3103948 RepID=UPI002B3EB9CA|nr:putative oxidoreductase C-terminal domain-containing protein [Algoriphagus sp. D3-2-R+10]MEB2775415.1 putative oxidoreductase C-terminal domain-containing protein [Algoriphagus sp. D3-2-R+10]
MKNTALVAIAAGLLLSCENKERVSQAPESKPEITIMSLDPGHFHAGLIHKSMYPQVDSTVYVFAPEGAELKDYMNRLSGYNNRDEDPTIWNLQVSIGDDYLEKMTSTKPGNVMMVAGKNDRKIDYISTAISNGINVYADKPLVINKVGFQKLIKAFEEAGQKDLLLYDIMTERFEISTILQKELSMVPAVFGELEKGTLENPAITKESAHHFFKYVSGNPLIRPVWFFDTDIEGTGIVDVTTHLVDLIQWEAFPGVTLDTADVQMQTAKLWSTDLDLDQFKLVTGQAEFPDFLMKNVSDNKLSVNSNGEMNYTLKGVHSKVSVIWNYQAPEGAADTHYSMMRGTKANLIIQQGEAENYVATLYVELLDGQDEALVSQIKTDLQGRFPGLDLEKISNGKYRILIPEAYHNGHEAHFAQVTEKYLEYLSQGNMPSWEVPNMIVKYFTTTEALAKAEEK